MEPNYITIIQAAELTGKSPASTRRLIKNLLATDATTPYIKTEKLANGSPKYYIDRNYLSQPGTHMEGEPGTQPGTQPGTHMEGEIIALLRQQLEEKDHQIANFQERDREHNILIKGLHERLLLIEAPKQQTPIDSEPKPEPTTPDPLPRHFFWQRKKRRF